MALLKRGLASKKSKFFFLFLLIFMLSSSTFALADSESFKDKILFQGNVSSQEKERVTQEIQEYIKLTGQELRDAGQWKVVYGSPKTVRKSGYCGNQPSGGTRFKSGGGFIITTGVGPKMTINFSFPLPYKNISFGFSLGSVSQGVTGVLVTVPSTYYYYKARATWTATVEPYATYKKVNGKWQLFYSGGNILESRDEYEAVRVR